MNQNQSCKYHPSRSAAWLCASCQINFCAHCVPQAVEDNFPNCSLCKKSLSRLSIADNIAPFWQILPKLALFPLSALGWLIGFWGLLLSLIPEGVIGLAVLFLSLFPLTEILFKQMEQVANNEWKKIKLLPLLKQESHGFFIRIILAFSATFLLVVNLGAQFGKGMGLALFSIVLFLVPASMMVLAIEKRFVSMLSLPKLILLVRLLRTSYLVLYATLAISCYLIFSFNLHIHAQGSSGTSPAFLAMFIGNSLSIYFLSVLFAMMGYLIYQHHVELNYRVAGKDLESSRALELSDLTEIEVFIQEGRFEDAQSELIKLIATDPSNHKANKTLILLYNVQAKDSFRDKIADDYFECLVSNSKAQLAAEYLCELMSKDINYYPKDETVAYEVAKHLNSKNSYHVGIRLLNQFDLTPRGLKRWDRMALLKARLLAEFGNDFGAAVAILELILKRSTDEAILEQADNLKKLLVVNLG